MKSIPSSFDRDVCRFCAHYSRGWCWRCQAQVCATDTACENMRESKMRHRHLQEEVEDAKRLLEQLGFSVTGTGLA